jgi:imidazole glycerol-phosphate synthase subunit HisH
VIVIVDYGMGNLGSIANMFKKIGTSAEVSSDPNVVKRADKLVLPGVGAFDAGMREIDARGLRTVLTEKVIGEATPILGICLGTQLMTKGSEEGTSPGLGWIDADTVRFRFPDRASLRVPHMGWNEVCPAKESLLVSGLDALPRFYFVHSYHLVCREKEDVLMTADYGYKFVAAVERGNIVGVQFHPEKSHKFGLQLLRNFSSLS